MKWAPESEIPRPSTVSVSFSVAQMTPVSSSWWAEMEERQTQKPHIGRGGPTTQVKFLVPQSIYHSSGAHWLGRNGILRIRMGLRGKIIPSRWSWEPWAPKFQQKQPLHTQQNQSLHLHLRISAPCEADALQDPVDSPQDAWPIPTSFPSPFFASRPITGLKSQQPLAEGWPGSCPDCFLTCADRRQGMHVVKCAG